jgi:mannose-6-phosphate isomerase-like protein (cupin superfamily)
MRVAALDPDLLRHTNTSMKSVNIRDAKSWFQVLQTSRKSQIATMTLAPGKSSGPKGNEHPKSEQVLFVVEGEILAELGEEKSMLRKGDAIIVPTGVAHRFTNHGGSAAVTFNVYAPPAYAEDESA